VKTFCVGFVDDATYDERKYARDVAARFDCEHTEIELAALPTDQLGGLLHFHDEPYGDASALAVHAVSKATRPHVTVVLTGDGGDEVFAGYTRFRGGMLTGAVPRSASRLARALLTRVPEPRGYKNRVAIVRRFVEHGERSGDEQLLAWNAYFAGPELARLLNPTAYGRNFDPWSVLREQIAILELARQQGHDRLDQILRHNYATYLLDDLLVKADRMTMSVALEARAPFLDTALVELAFRLPSRMKLRHGRLKGLLREAYRDILPPSVLDRQKHGFGVPIGRWWSGALAPMVDDLLIAPGARVFEYLDAARLAEVVREHRTGRRNHDLRIFALLQLELWLRGLAR
jgi:asparagine synthase (glutamine-hydrolysing)